MTTKRTFWILLFVCIITLLPFIGLYDYNTKGEPRESIVSYSMLETGNWILSRNNGGEMAYKPPFFHWCVAAVSYVWGSVTEATSRFPSVVALVAMIMSGFCFFARRRDVRTSLVTAIICLTCFELHRAGMNCRVDMLLTALTCGALYMLYRWYEQGQRGIPLIAILIMSAGTMTKGPVGALIPCICMGAFLLMKKQNFFRAFFTMICFSLLSFILPAFWYYAAWQQGGQEFYDLMMEENIGRMTNTMAYNSCVEPWWFNFLTLVYGFLPFTLLLLFSLFSLKGAKVCQCDNGIKGNWQKFTNWLFNLKDVDLFSIVCAVVIVGFYCIPQSKRSVYLMPAYPFIAYFIARFMIWLAENRKKSLNVYGWVLCVISAILLLLTVALKLHLMPETLFGHSEQNIRTIHNLEDINGFIVWASIAVVVISCFYWVKREVSPRGDLAGVLFLVIALNIGLDGAWKPAALNAKSVKPIAAIIDRYAPEGEGKLYEYIEGSVVALGDPVHFFELNFYLQHPNRIGNFYKEKPRSGFLIIRKEEYLRHKTEFEGWGYNMSVLHETEQSVWGSPLSIVKFHKNITYGQ